MLRCASHAAPSRRIRFSFGLPLAPLALVLLVPIGGCGDDDGGGGLLRPPDARVSDGQLIALDSYDRDLAAAPDLPVNLEGPEIEILTPESDQIIVGGVLRVTAKVVDVDGIDAQTVGVTLQGETGDPVPMGLTVTPQVYEALLDVRALAGPARLWVVASDLLGNTNSAIREFERDPGPVISFLSPTDQSRHKSSVSLQVVVGDLVQVTDFSVRLGTHQLTLKETAKQENQTIYVTTIDFDDPAFGAPLSGKQVLTASATNVNGARNVVTRTFFVDDQGPDINVLSHAPGDLIGSVIEIEVEVSDLAGVNAATVQCVIGNEQVNRKVDLRQEAATPSLFRGQFDTATLTDEQLWPVMSFRAEDVLGNRSHYDIEVGLDNGPPVVSLDPPENFAYWREVEGVIQCSHTFDPVGPDAANDLNAVTQTPDIRVRVEDQGNFVPSAWKPIATVDPATVRLFILPASSNKPLVIDTDDDGWCDAINPEVVPRGSDLQPGEAVALNLTSVPPGGLADFTPYVLPSQLQDRGCESPGDADAPPQGLCEATPTTVAIYYNAAKQPAIWTIPPVEADDLKCLGLPFDFRNEIPNGWACVAASARDQLGNLGVSQPIRLYWDRENEPSFNRPVPDGTPAPPNCTGTVDMASGTVVDTPCNLRMPFGLHQVVGTKACTRDDECCSANGVKGCGRYVGRCLTDFSGARRCVSKWPQVFSEWEVREQ